MRGIIVLLIIILGLQFAGKLEFAGPGLRISARWQSCGTNESDDDGCRECYMKRY